MLEPKALASSPKAQARACAIVDESICATFPPGVPPSHKNVILACFVDANRIDAQLEMFDGLPASVTLSRWTYGWSIHYAHLPGGAVAWFRSQWTRRPRG